MNNPFRTLAWKWKQYRCAHLCNGKNVRQYFAKVTCRCLICGKELRANSVESLDCTWSTPPYRDAPRERLFIGGSKDGQRMLVPCMERILVASGERETEAYIATTVRIQGEGMLVYAWEGLKSFSLLCNLLERYAQPLVVTDAEKRRERQMAALCISSPFSLSVIRSTFDLVKDDDEAELIIETAAHLGVDPVEVASFAKEYSTNHATAQRMRS